MMKYGVRRNSRLVDVNQAVRQAKPNLVPHYTYAQVAAWSAENQGQLFEDAEFPAVDESLFYSQRPPGEFEWKRPHELTKEPQFIARNADRSDVNQGELGDCWLLAAVASLTLNDFNFQRVCPPDQTFDRTKGYCGAFRFNFWHYGEWIEVAIDDRLPTFSGRLVFTHSRAQNEFWPALLEKAYAKLQGSYEALRGGSTSEAQEDFTGGVAEIHPLQKETPADLWVIMERAQARNSLMASSIKQKSGHAPEAVLPNGLIMGHAYSVTAVEVVTLKNKEKAPLVRLRNPWGTDAKWKGAWCDGAPEWELVGADERDRIELVFLPDGEFWMCYRDFTASFEQLEICNLTPDSLSEGDTHAIKRNWSLTMKHGSWVRNVSAGGCRQFVDTFWTNPQYAIYVPGGDDDETASTVIIALMQKDRRGGRREGHQLLSIGYIIYRLPEPSSNQPQPLDFFKYNPAADKSGPFINRREVAQRHRLEVGDYVVVPSTFDPGEEGEFLLRIATERPSFSTEMDGETKLYMDLDAIRAATWRNGAGDGNANHVTNGSSPSTPAVDRRVRLAFRRAVGTKSAMNATELRTAFNDAFSKEMDFGGFSKETCRSMLAMMDVSYAGELHYDEFEKLWATIQRFKTVFQRHDRQRTGALGSMQLRTALRDIGINVQSRLLRTCVVRFASADGSIDFDDFVMMCIRLTSMADRFNDSQTSKPDLETFLLLTIYS